MEAHTSRRRFLTLGAVGLAGLAGCLGGSGGSTGRTSPEATVAGEDDGGASTTGGSPSFADGGPPLAEATLPLPFEPAGVRERAVSGGVRRDGIPSIDDPSFESVGAAAEWLEPGDPVFGVVGEDEVKAYPQKILVQHEICNDTLDGRPVSVTYCPLTGTALGYLRGGTTFGVSGRLVNNNLIMYDRSTEAWWPQVLATSIPGPWFEDPPTRSLQRFQVIWTTLGRWRERYPETKVLSRDTGHPRSYGQDPYGRYNPRGGYYADDRSPMFPSLSEDGRYPPKAVVIGTRTPDGALAFHKDTLREEKLMTGTLGGTSALAAYDSRLDTAFLYLNPDGETYEYDEGAVVGPDGASNAPDDLPLEQLVAFDAMWFAWDGFYPEAEVRGPE